METATRETTMESVGPATSGGQERVIEAIEKAAAVADTANVRTTAAAQSLSRNVAALGNMGLKGSFAVFGQTTAMVLIAVSMFWGTPQSAHQEKILTESHKQAVSILERILDKTTETQNKSLIDMSNEFKDLSNAVRDLNREIRLWRNEKRGE